MNKITNIKNRTFATVAATPAINLNPSRPAIKATIKNPNVHPSTILII